MIQQVRFENKFSYSVTMEEGIGENATLKLIVQPIVENAIYHGMEYMYGDGAVSYTHLDVYKRQIAEKALERKTGARALRAIIEEFMLDIMYEIPKDDSIGRVVITRDYIEHTGGPVITMRGVPALEG